MDIDVLRWLKDIWTYELFQTGKASISLSTLVFMAVSITFLIFIAKRLKKITATKILQKYNLDVGITQSIATIVQYTIVAIGLMVIVQSSGIDLSALGILVGALGVGIGFGLQNITSNFISGIIILFERPIKVGDRVEMGDIIGNISHISARATTVVTNDNISIIVPNSEFINSKVINWSLNNKRIRLNFLVGVSYKEDPEKIRRLLLHVAEGHLGVMKNPASDVLFDDFGDSSLVFNLRVWTEQYADKPKVLKSELFYEIFRLFKEEGVEIPFPQRDLHIKGWPPLQEGALPKIGS